jgi:hypothetical protein
MVHENMKTNILLIMALAMVLCSFAFVHAENTWGGIQNQDVMIKVPCENNGSICSGFADCNISIDYPNNTEIISFDQMQNLNNGQFNYTLLSSYTSAIGCYPTTVSCCDGGFCDTITYCTNITPSGEEATIGKAILYIGLLFLFVCFLIVSISIFVKYNTNLITKTGMFGLSYLLLVTTTFIGWQMSKAFLTSSPFLIEMLWLLFFILMIGIVPVILGAFAYILIITIKIKEIQRLMDHGFSQNDAQDRVRRKK